MTGLVGCLGSNASRSTERFAEVVFNSPGLKIGVDVDDVLFPWFDTAHSVCVNAGIAELNSPPKQWECWLDYGVEQEVWLEALRVATLDGSLYAGALYPGVVERMQLLRDAGHQLNIVTARGFFQHGDLIRAATIETLREVPHDSLTFSKDKTIVRNDIFVDDSWKNVQATEAAGIPTWMVDAPHNQDADFGFRVPSFNHFADMVLGLEEIQ